MRVSFPPTTTDSVDDTGVVFSRYGGGGGTRIRCANTGYVAAGGKRQLEPLIDPRHSLSKIESEMIITVGPTAMIDSQTETAASLVGQTPAADLSIARGLLRLKFIGPMEATTVNGDNVLPLGRKARALLAILAISARPVGRSRLAELLWSQRNEEQGRALLRQELHRLGEALQPVHEGLLNPTRDRVALNMKLVSVDLDEVLRATPANPAGLLLLDGIVLEGLDDIDPALDIWIAVERERIQDKARALADSLLHRSLTPEQTVGAAKQLLKLDRANEGGWVRLMLAYHALGKPRLALDAFAQCRAALAELLDALPSSDVRRLAADIGRGTTISPHTMTVRAHGEPAPPRPGPRNLWLGVLPLRAHHPNQAEAGWPLDVAQAITSALSLFSEYSVVPVERLAPFGDRDETALRQAFGLDLLLDGSLRRAAAAFQLDLRLLDLRAGNQVVWTHRFKRTLVGSQMPLAELAAELAAQIDLDILRLEGQRASLGANEPADAYDLVMRAMPLIPRLQREEFGRAGALLSKAMVLDPTYAAACAWRAYWIIFAVGQGWIADLDAAVAEARQLAERTLILDPENARFLSLIGLLHTCLTRQPRDACALHARAMALNPNLAMAWGLAGMTSTFLGSLAEATSQFERYRRLAPHDANGFLFDTGMALHALLRGDFAEAVLIGRRASELNPQLALGLKIYLAALGQSGRIADAGPVLARIRAIEPGFTIRKAVDRMPLVRSEDLDCYATGLARAGV